MLLCGKVLPTAPPLTLPYWAEHCGTVTAALMEGSPGTDASTGRNPGSPDDALRGGGPGCVLVGAASQGVVPGIATPTGIVMHIRTFSTAPGLWCRVQENMYNNICGRSGA